MALPPHSPSSISPAASISPCSESCVRRRELQSASIKHEESRAARRSKKRAARLVRRIRQVIQVRYAKLRSVKPSYECQWQSYNGTGHVTSFVDGSQCKISARSVYMSQIRKPYLTDQQLMPQSICEAIKMPLTTCHCPPHLL